MFAFMLWPGEWGEKGKIGLTVGVIQPFLIWGWFAAAQRFAPKQAESLKGTNGDLTILPWTKVRKDKITRRKEVKEQAERELDAADDVAPTRVLTDEERREITGPR